MRIVLKYTDVDGNETSVTAAAPEFVAFEREFDRSIARLQNDLRFTDLCWLAWKAATRGGATNLGFDEWLGTLETVEAAPPEDQKLTPLETSPPIG